MAQAEPTAEQVHTLRVTARRMRHDLRLFGAGLRGKSFRAIDKGLRAWSVAVRDVRACDTLIDNAEQYRERCDDEAREGMLPLLNAWRERRAAASARLRALAQSDDAQDWLDSFEAFVRGEGKHAAPHQPDVGEPSRVRHLLPVSVWQGIAGVRAFDTLPDVPMPHELHALRLAIKRLRYTVEALRDVMPADEAEAWLDRCIPAQDALGAIQDAHVSVTQTQAFVTQNRPGARPTQRVAAKGIVTYAEAQRKVIDTRIVPWRDYLHPFL
jgi:CHAD domain-containing protein